MTLATVQGQIPSRCAADNAGLTLPPGFCATVAAEGLRAPRHLAVAANGDIYVALSRDSNASVALLRDTNNDGRAEVALTLGRGSATGLALTDRYLYLGLNDGVVRYTLPLAAGSVPDTIAWGLLNRRQHAAKAIAVDGDNLYVNIGAPSNSCQERDRQPGSPGRNPCTLLDSAGGIWRFDANRTGQTQASGRRFATGLRNVVALTFDREGRSLYAAQHGRDDLARLFPAHFNNEQNAEKPAEIFVKISENGDYGWPYCYYDPATRRSVLMPEYGGDGTITGRCGDMSQPVAAYPAHWAPNGVVIYRGAAFPPEYRGGAFLAFHGSWNRAPMPQAGFNVVFQPMNGSNAAGEYRVFADGFRGSANGQATNRPTGLAVGPDGSLYVSDDTGGRIYRIYYSR